MHCLEWIPQTLTAIHTWILDNSAMAAWIQALGSIGAIVYAGRLARKQLAEDSRLRVEAAQEAEDRMLDGIRGIVAGIGSQIDVVINPIISVFKNEIDTTGLYHVDTARTICMSLESIDLTKIGKADLIQSILSLRLRTNYVKRICETNCTYISREQPRVKLRFNEDEMIKIRDAIQFDIKSIYKKTLAAHNRLAVKNPVTPAAPSNIESKSQ